MPAFTKSNIVRIMDNQLVYVSNNDRNHLNGHVNSYPSLQPTGYPNSGRPRTHPNSHKPHLNLPEFLYYVEYIGSQAMSFDQLHGPRLHRDILAPDTSRRYLSKPGLKQLVAEHLQHMRDKHNSRRRPSCFLSAFSNITNVFYWGMRQTGPVWVRKIDTKLLPCDMSKHWVGWVPGQDEYLFLHRIPCAAIVYEHQIKEDDRGPQTPESMTESLCSLLEKTGNEDVILGSAHLSNYFNKIRCHPTCPHHSSVRWTNARTSQQQQANKPYVTSRGYQELASIFSGQGVGY